MESPDSPTRAPATPTDNTDKLDKLDKTASLSNVYRTASLQKIDSSDFPELPEPWWNKYLPNIYSEKRVLNLSAFQMNWAVQMVAGIAILFFGFGEYLRSCLHYGCIADSDSP